MHPELENADPALGRRGARLVWEHSSGVRRHIVLYAVASLALVAAQLALPGLVAASVDAATTRSVGWELLALMAAIALLLIGIAASTVASTRVSAALSASLRQRLLDHAIGLGVPGRRPFSHGDLLNRFAGDVRQLEMFLEVWSRTVTTGLLGVGALIALFVVDWIFAALFVVMVGATLWFARRLMVEIADSHTGYRRYLGEVVTRYVDAIAGRRTIRASGTFAREVARVTAPLPDVCAAGLRVVAVDARANVILGGAYDATRIMMIVTAAVLLSRGRIAPAALLAAVGYGQLALGHAIGFIGGGVFALPPLRVATGRTVDVLDTRPATPDPDRALPAPAGAGDLVFSGVTVDASEGRILDGVDLHVPGGTTLAVVGRSGAGKSTIAALVGRLLDPDEGMVTIDGVDVRLLERSDLAALVTYAFETPALLGETVADTIEYGSQASDEELRTAAATAAADGFIERMPDGYATPLEQAPLSGGERQRLGLARSALRRARVLVLDDAMSSLDVATEARVAASFAALSRGRTTLIVAHRASTAARADMVAWLDDGRIRRIAPHGELWAEPAYRSAFSATDAAK